jgi:hypothetical protein
MMKIRFSRTAFATIVLLACVGLSFAQDDDGPLSKLQFLVVRDSDGKPVRNAQVVLHPVKAKGKQGQGEFDLKTDPEGKTSVDGIPYGTLRVQVMAPHFQTFGEDYEINKPDFQITVKLKHPADPYSVYENHPNDNDKKPQ